MRAFLFISILTLLIIPPSYSILCSDVRDKKCHADLCYSPYTEVCCGNRTHHWVDSKGSESCSNNNSSCSDGRLKCNVPETPSFTCYDSRTESCCNDGFLCQEPQKCHRSVRKGMFNFVCCGPGEVACGNRCVDPRHERCCTDSVTICRADEDCVLPSDGSTNLVCCPQGFQNCGKRCFDPEKDYCCVGWKPHGLCPAVEREGCCRRMCCEQKFECRNDAVFACGTTSTKTAELLTGPSSIRSPSQTTNEAIGMVMKGENRAVCGLAVAISWALMML